MTVVSNENSDLDDILGRKSSSPNPLLRIVPDWFKDRHNQLFLLLLFFVLLLHLLIVPSHDTLVYDEHHYVPEAISIIEKGELLTPEHPSLGKLFIASGILIFGDNQWGWRIPSVLFGVASVALFYLLCRKLAGKLTALFASILFACETVVFELSGIAMLDVFSMMFLLLAFLLYLHDKPIFSGVSLALSVICKFTGLLGVLVIAGHWFITRRKQSPRRIGFLLISALIGFMFFMPIFDFAATREWLNPMDRIWYMLVFHEGFVWAGMTVEQAILEGAAYPWEWILYPYGFRWVDIFTIYHVNFLVWILIIPSIGYMTYEYVKKKTEVSLFTILWFFSTYLPWLVLIIATDRLTYYFYFYPAVGAICLALGYIMKRLWETASREPTTQKHILIKIAIISFLAVNGLYFLLATLLSLAPSTTTIIGT